MRLGETRGLRRDFLIDLALEARRDELVRGQPPFEKNLAESIKSAGEAVRQAEQGMKGPKTNDDWRKAEQTLKDARAAQLKQGEAVAYEQIVKTIDSVRHLSDDEYGALRTAGKNCRILN